MQNGFHGELTSKAGGPLDGRVYCLLFIVIVVILPSSRLIKFLLHIFQFCSFFSMSSGSLLVMLCYRLDFHCLKLVHVTSWR